MVGTGVGIGIGGLSIMLVLRVCAGALCSCIESSPHVVPVAEGVSVGIGVDGIGLSIMLVLTVSAGASPTVLSFVEIEFSLLAN